MVNKAFSHASLTIHADTIQRKIDTTVDHLLRLSVEGTEAVDAYRWIHLLGLDIICLYPNGLIFYRPLLVFRPSYSVLI